MAAQILVVDNAKVTCDVLEEELPKHGFEVTIAHTGEDAIGRMEESTFVVLIIDHELPTRVSALDVMKRFRNLFRNGKIIALTGYPDPVFEEKAEAISIAAFLRKPLDLAPNVICERVQKVLEA